VYHLQKDAEIKLSAIDPRIAHEQNTLAQVVTSKHTKELNNSKPIQYPTWRALRLFLPH